jgi:hypothetical protein
MHATGHLRADDNLLILQRSVNPMAFFPSLPQAKLASPVGSGREFDRVTRGPGVPSMLVDSLQS